MQPDQTTCSTDIQFVLLLSWHIPPMFGDFQFHFRDLVLTGRGGGEWRWWKTSCASGETWDPALSQQTTKLQ